MSSNTGYSRLQKVTVMCRNLPGLATHWNLLLSKTIKVMLEIMCQGKLN